MPGPLSSSLEVLLRGLTAPLPMTDGNWWIDTLQATPLLIWLWGMLYIDRALITHNANLLKSELFIGGLPFHVSLL